MHATLDVLEYVTRHTHGGGAGLVDASEEGEEELNKGLVCSRAGHQVHRQGIHVSHHIAATNT